MKEKGYKAKTQTEKNIAWFLPRPKPDHYKGGMPLYCEEWLIDLAKDILNNKEPAILNVFCGMNRLGTRIDIRREVNPDWVWDIHELSELVPYWLGKFQQVADIILADPPYSDIESKELYGTGKINYKKWTSECDKVLKPGGLLIIYHKFMVKNPNPDKYEVVKRVFIGNRIGHLARIAIYFRKKNAGNNQ